MGTGDGTWSYRNCGTATRDGFQGVSDGWADTYTFKLGGQYFVLDGILKAGLRSNSLPEKAYLARPHPAGGPDQVLRIDWERIKMGDTFTNYQLLPGDRIVVPGGRPPGLLATLFGGA